MGSEIHITYLLLFLIIHLTKTYLFFEKSLHIDIHTSRSNIGGLLNFNCGGRIFHSVPCVFMARPLDFVTIGMLLFSAVKENGREL